MKEFLTICFLFIGYVNMVLGQSNVTQDFQSPLEIPLFLSGNFGELRTGHFHAGIDLKTNREIGKKVLASFDGYVSRIKIQSGGYGHSLYITHPNGYTTVYAHLDKYIPEIEQYVKHNQYLRQSYEIELFPSKDMFRVEKGDLIAYSGNSGRSGGPHLHFEIRKTNGQVPQNGLRYNFPVNDTIPPQFRNLYVYSDTGRTEYPVNKISDSVYEITGVAVIQKNQICFAAEVYDFLNGSNNKCGVYSMQLFVEQMPVYQFQIDEISFSKTRYINAHMDYDLKVHEGKSVHRLFSLPHNELTIYKQYTCENSFQCIEDSVYKAEIIASDVYGNTSTLNFAFTCFPVSDTIQQIKNTDNFCEWNRGGEYNLNNLSVSIPSKALYRDVYLQLNTTGLGAINDTFFIHKASEPLHKNIGVNITLDSVQERLTEKILLVKINSDGDVDPMGGAYKHRVLSTSMRSFGKFIIAFDTIPPKISPVKSRNSYYSAGDTLQFKIDDDLSGIKSYNAYIDNNWELFRFDAKSGKLMYVFEDESIKADAFHLLNIEVIDNKGNKAVHTSKFIYY